MGNCKYCGKSAGILKSEHSECKQKFEEEKETKTKHYISEIISGNFPAYSPEQISVVLQKDESVAYISENVVFAEVRTKTTYEGSSKGVSVRVMKGVTVRSGAFKGKPVVNTTLQEIDTGKLIITNQGLYFSGNLKKFRVKYKDIMEFTPYPDGIGIVKNTGSARPQAFKTENAEFIYSIIIGLAKKQI